MKILNVLCIKIIKLLKNIFFHSMLLKLLKIFFTKITLIIKKEEN